jgi:DNA-binding MurR/RpiR family transcriptional regulator
LIYEKYRIRIVTMNGTLAQRIAAIRLSARSLAAEAGVTPATIYRLLNGRNKRGGWAQHQQDIERAVAAEEIRLRDYLCSLHGPPQGE